MGVAIHADGVVLDHVTVERQPPGHLDVGISLEGNNAVAYAIAVKHVEQDGVRWRGEDGHAFALNVDLPRDALIDFQNGGYVGYVSATCAKARARASPSTRPSTATCACARPSDGPRRRT